MAQLTLDKQPASTTYHCDICGATSQPTIKGARGINGKLAKYELCEAHYLNAL